MECIEISRKIEIHLKVLLLDIISVAYEALKTADYGRLSPLNADDIIWADIAIDHPTISTRINQIIHKYR